MCAGRRRQDAARRPWARRRTAQGVRRLRPRLPAGTHPNRGGRWRRDRRVHRRPGHAERPARRRAHRDALHCQREQAHWLHARGGHYLFTVKANQPTLRRALAALPWAQAPRSRRREAAHGRTESRSIKVIDLDGDPAAALLPPAARAIKVVRRRREQRTGKTSTETVYAITSLNHRQADPGLLAGWIQGHWGIENRVHHIRDVTQGADASRIHTGTGPQVMTTLRNTALNLHHLDEHTNIASAQRRTGWRARSAHATIRTA